MCLSELSDEPVRWLRRFPETSLAVTIGVGVVLVTFRVTSVTAYVTQQTAIALLSVEESTANEAPTSQLRK